MSIYHSVHSDFDYSIRQMSGSTVSAAETGSSVASRLEKRSLSPSGSSSPEPRRPRSSLSTEHPSWDFDSDTKIVETGLVDHLGTAISSTSLSSSHPPSPNFTSPPIPDIRSQVTPTSTYMEGESGTPYLPPNRIADFTLHQLRLGMTGILLTRMMPTPRITRH
jgi:hypothetical protein